MRAIFSLLFAFCIMVSAMAQDYKPKSGETVMKIAIEGRGNVFIKLFTEKAPKATSHIIELVKKGFYDGQRFHLAIRSPKPYRVQVGDPATKTKDVDDPSVGTGGSGSRIPYEDSGYSNKEGYVGLSTLKNDKNTGDSQFYILLADQPFLDGNYTVFGKVVDGMDVVNKIEKGDKVLSVKILTG